MQLNWFYKHAISYSPPSTLKICVCWMLLFIRMKHSHGEKLCFMVHGFLVPQLVVVVTDAQVSFYNSYTWSNALSTSLENFWKNPQYLIHLNLDDDTNRDQLCTMIIFLTIKKPNERHARRAEDEICFQFRVYKVRSYKESSGW